MAAIIEGKRGINGHRRVGMEKVLEGGREICSRKTTSWVKGLPEKKRSRNVGSLSQRGQTRKACSVLPKKA